MKLLYKKRKLHILNNCWYDSKFENYCQKLTGRGVFGYQILDDSKIIGLISDNGKLRPMIHECFNAKSPEEVFKTANEMGLEIEMDCALQGGKGMKLYYWKGEYRRAKDLWPVNKIG